MNPIDFLVIGIVAAILGLVIFYIVRAKKKGVKCIGCPDGARCSGHCASCGGCACGDNPQENIGL